MITMSSKRVTPFHECDGMRLHFGDGARNVAGWVLLSCFLTVCRAQTPEFVSFASAQPALAAMRDSLPPELKTGGPITPAAWDKWVRKRDREIRARLEEGEELTLTNLLRLGVTYTKEARIDYQDLDRYQRSGPVNSRAENRANDLIRALAAPRLGEGLLEMREFLEKKGFSLKTPEGQKKTKEYILACLARQRDSAARTRQQAKVDPSQAFKDRGLSTDSDLYPDYMIDQHLRNMVEKGLLKPGSVHRVAIAGPGLDFVNKKYGADFYPPQTTQPFAVIDSLVRLRLADPASIEVYTFDISPRVNLHIERARENGAAGKPYTVQLLCSISEGWNPEYVASLRKYWQRLGDQVGTPVTPIPVPAAVRETIVNRAVSIRPEVVTRITPVDMNVVFQTLPLPPDQRFDLVIGTNIFLYYDALEQSLARANLSAMIKAGGFLLSNTALAGAAPSKLVDSLKTSVLIADAPLFFDGMFSYVRQR